MRRQTSLTAFLVLLLASGAAPQETEGQSWRTVTMSRQLTGEEALEVDVSFGAGTLRVHPSDQGLLYRMELRYDEELFEPEVDYESGRLELGLDRTGSRFSLARSHSGGELDLGLSGEVALDLDLEFGAMRADIELGGLSLSGLTLSTGASESTVRVSSPNPVPMERARIEAGAARFGASSLGNLNAERIQVEAGLGEMTLSFDGEWQRDAAVDIDMGVGSLDLRFPRGLGVRLEMDSFLTSFDSQGLVKQGEAYYSTDWEDAERRVTIQIDAAVGRVGVRWIP